MTREEFIKRINNNKYYSLWDVQEHNLTRGVMLVDHGLNYVSRGWYSITTDVYETEDGYVGVRGVNYCKYSAEKNFSYKSIGVLCEAFPMKQVIIQTFIREK